MSLEIRNRLIKEIIGLATENRHDIRIAVIKKGDRYLLVLKKLKRG